MDIALMSTGRDWTSCMELDKGSHHKSVYCEVKEGGLIAYLIRGDDKDIKKPLARVLIRRFDNQEGDSVAIPENTVYGNVVEGFEDVIRQWLQSKQGVINPGHYQRKGGKWSDTFPEKMLVPPTNKEDILKWLRKEQPVINTEWIVEDNFEGHFQGEPDDEGERISPSFKTEEEAQRYIRQNELDYWEEEEDMRHRISNNDKELSNNDNELSWLEKDEDGDWKFDRFTIRKKEKNFTDDMQTEAIKLIIHAPKGEYPIEVLQEIKQITTGPKIHYTKYFDYKSMLMQKYPELFTEEEYKNMGGSKFIEYIKTLPDDSIRKQQVKQHYLQQTETQLKDPTSFYTMTLHQSIVEYLQSNSINIKSSQDTINLYFSVSFSDNILRPIEELFTKDYKGTQKSTPIPESTTRALVDFCEKLSTLKIADKNLYTGDYADAAEDIYIKGGTLQKTFLYVARLFHNSGTETPTVVNFYKWITKSYWGDILKPEYSYINIESMCDVLGGLGVNGRDLIPWAKQQLEIEQNKYNAEKPSYSNHERDARKLNIERWLYVIDAWEHGTPSGKYRTYSRKNWLTKLAYLV